MKYTAILLVLFLFATTAQSASFNCQKIKLINSTEINVVIISTARTQ